MKKKLLINFVYYRPVGHVVEALKYARGYYMRNKNIEIHLLLNADSPIEIAQSCNWIKKVYPISLREVSKYGKKAPSLRRINKNWDFIVSDFRVRDFKKGWDENDLIKTQAILQKLFTARIAQGHTQIKKPILPYLKIYFTGVTKSDKGRTATDNFTTKDINALVGKLQNAENCFNIGMWKQLALIKQCDMFLSPHTGFAFLAPCFGTPWLALSGCPWSEYIFNDIPFFSVLPDCGYYPSQGEAEKGCGKLLWNGKKSFCMKDAALRKKIPEIVRGAKLLLDPKFTYQKAVDRHLKNIKKKRIQNMYFLDGVDSLIRTRA